MALVTVTLNDVGLGHLAGKQPQLLFALSGPATSPAGVFVTDPVVVVPDAAGAASVQLEPTETMHQQRYYQLSVRWLGQTPDGSGVVRADFPDWQVFVPVAGGNLRDLVPAYTADHAGWNPLMVLYSPTEPVPWPAGAVWVDTSVDTPTSGDLRRKA